MPHDPESMIPYKRSRFSTRLPAAYRYTAAHFWLREAEPGLWHVGLTKFALRMLGDLVEHGFDIKPGQAVEPGDIIGWLEGFKAVTDLFCVAKGEFVGGNPALEADLGVLDGDPYGAGWVYAVRGEPDPDSVDVRGYVGILDLTIDKMQGKTS